MLRNLRQEREQSPGIDSPRVAGLRRLVDAAIDRSGNLD
jgi:hypothetical protein